MNKKRILVIAAFAIQTFATGWMVWHYDPEARHRAQTWEWTARMTGAALDRCQAPRGHDIDERTTGGPSDNRA